LTIGIAAFGPRAGLAVYKALMAAESIGSGAIGGFVSYVVIGTDGQLYRSQTQEGGARALFDGDEARLPPEIAKARHAGLMSSGPNRPEPLGQFTPADPMVGIVTGHRFPNTIGENGVSLGEEILSLMRRGATVDHSVASIVSANPTADAGFIALAIDGRICTANTRHVDQFTDAGHAALGSLDDGYVVAVLHNAIRPHRSLALYTAEIAVETLSPAAAPDGYVRLEAGTRLSIGVKSAIEIDAAAVSTRILVPDSKYLSGHWNFGIGYRVDVISRHHRIGYALYEPYMVIDEGKIVSIDGAASLTIPMHRCP
jgi:hypothetical protein